MHDSLGCPPSLSSLSLSRATPPPSEPESSLEKRARQASSLSLSLSCTRSGASLFFLPRCPGLFSLSRRACDLFASFSSLHSVPLQPSCESENRGTATAAAAAARGEKCAMPIAASPYMLYAAAAAKAALSELSDPRGALHAGVVYT